MKPYLRAFHEYQRHERGETWTDALDFHLQHGVVVSTPEVFGMIRPVGEYWPEAWETELIPYEHATTRWHVWVVAGDLAKLLTLAGVHGVATVSYQRHGQQVMRVQRIKDLARRGCPPVQSVG